jgi:hypothetical protein
VIDLCNITLPGEKAMKYKKRITVKAYRSSESITYHRNWGDRKYPPGHWVIVGPNNDIYGCDAKIFESTYELVQGTDDEYKKTVIVSAKRLDGAETIITTEGTAFGKRGDWVVTDYEGNRYLVAHKVFSETYEPVSEES